MYSSIVRCPVIKGIHFLWIPISKYLLSCPPQKKFIHLQTLFLLNFRDELDPAEEKIDYLKLEEATPYLIFEQGDGGCTLKGGEIEALIAYAASTSSSGIIR